MGNFGIKGVTTAADTIDTEGWEVVGREPAEGDGNGTDKDHAGRRCPSFDGLACVIM